MLLRNESRIRHTIDIKLVYDDDRVRELQLNEGDTIQISYRKDGRVTCGVGVIRDIKIYIKTKELCNCINNESAIIVLDMSEDYRCFVEKIDLYDIIDVRHVTIEDTENDNTSDSDFDVTIPGGITQCPLVCENCKGVVTND